MRSLVCAVTAAILAGGGLLADPWTAAAEPGDLADRRGGEAVAPGSDVAAPEGHAVTPGSSPAPWGSSAGAPPGLRVHVVQPGETAFRIARRYGVSVEALAAANGLTDPARLRVGQVLRVPGGSPAASGPPGRGTAGPPASTSMARGSVDAPVSRQATEYVVRPGDTLYSLARGTGASVTALQRLNGLRDHRLRVGQVLRLPGRALAGAPGSSRPVPEPAALASTLPAAAVRSRQPAAAAATPGPPATIGARIVPARPVAVFLEPQYDSGVAAIVDAGTPLAGGQRQGRWMQVSLPDGQAGWALARDLGMEPPAAGLSAAGLPTAGGPSTQPLRPSGLREPPDSPGARPLRDVDALLSDARRLVGVPYVWGGTSAQGADCSGFVWLVYAPRSPGLPRTSFEMFRVGTPVSREDLRPGDLMFFTTYAPGPSHVGIYMGDGQFAHGSSGARRVVVTPLADPYYAARYLGARRILH